MEPIERIVEILRLENGFDIDIDEGWNKLISSQFGGSPGRAFSELIQNSVDSYPSGTPWTERRAAISATSNSISITDWGEGMNTQRLSLLATAGGTDKSGDPDKIGRFGLGFISIFNPRLGTRLVEVVTMCHGYAVQLVFRVADPKKRPEITSMVLDKTISFSTCITIHFSPGYSVRDCLDYAEKSLTYYPCPITINGELFQSEWSKFNSGGILAFSENNCDGIIRKNAKWYNVNILCKYELVMTSTVSNFITGGHNMHHNLDDYEKNSTPYIPNVDVLININNLQLVISRDNYYLDWYWTEAKALLNRKLRYFLYLELSNVPKTQVIIANQFIFRYELRDFLNSRENLNSDKEENKIIRLLAEAPVYRINGRTGVYSLVQLKGMLRKSVPFYYSPERTNLRWLGGSFRHDYIVIPENCTLISGAPLLYDRLFETVFNDVINLDGIVTNHKKIQDLLERGIINKSSLLPKCKFIGTRNLSENQKNTLYELSQILEDQAIRELIGNNLQIQVRSVKPVFFSIKNEGVYLSTGLFDTDGKPVNNDFVSNIMEKTADNDTVLPKKKQTDLYLGLNMDHPFINFLVESTSPQKEYYTLTFLAHELVLCQKMLVPYSPFYHLVKEKLAQDMRKILVKYLLKCIKN